MSSTWLRRSLIHGIAAVLHAATTVHQTLQCQAHAYAASPGAGIRAMSHEHMCMPWCRWQDFSLYGHQIVAHEVPGYSGSAAVNPVDGDPVPVPHYGLALAQEQFHALADRVRGAGVTFEIEPHIRFSGQPGASSAAEAPQQRVRRPAHRVKGSGAVRLRELGCRPCCVLKHSYFLPCPEQICMSPGLRCELGRHMVQESSGPCSSKIRATTASSSRR